MKMKALVRLMSGSLAMAALASCGNPEQKIRVSVADEAGCPVENALCKAFFNRSGASGMETYTVEKVTDTGGVAELVGETLWYRTAVKVTSPGFYEASAGDHWTIKKNGNRWEPWPVEVKLILKKILRPHPMYVAKYDAEKWLSFPQRTLGPYGFDLTAGDWVEPYGKGKVADFILAARRELGDDPSPSPKGSLVVTFQNPGDGIQQAGTGEGSLLVGPTIAAEEGYQKTWTFENAKPSPGESGSLSSDFSDESYVFRVRTRLDDSGKVQSALYGKIDGRIVAWLPQKVPSVLLTYYLNAAPNDRGLEWDMKTNLINASDRERWPERP